MNPEERKEQILQCAKKLFARHGYYQTQISDIIKEAKIARGTIYQYFNNKEDIFVTLLEKFYIHWEQSISVNANEIDLKTITPKEYFTFRIQKTLAFFAKDPDLCRILLRIGLGLPGDMSTAIRRFEKRILNIVISDLTFAAKNGHVKEGLDVVLAAILISGAILRTAYYFYGFDETRRQKLDVDQVANEIANVLSPGILV